MSGTITSVAPTINASGITAPTYSDVLTYLQQQYQGIYGSDVYLGNDSQDGQWVAIIASAINNVNNACIAVYNSFSPATAQGVGLSSVVKINGLARQVASYSTVPLVIVGTAGTTLTNASVGDGTYAWALPVTVIPTSGTITVTATCTTLGAINAAPGTVNQILTPQLGWASATNTASAAPGAPVETDAQLRVRQSASTQNPAQSVLNAMQGALLALPGVTAVKVYENNTASTNAVGVPANSIAVVVEGGTASAIAATILARKGVGCGTYGTTSQTVTDVYGQPNTINYFAPTIVPIAITVTVHPLTGYSSIIGNNIVASVQAYVASLGIAGESGVVRITRLYVPAQLLGPFAVTTSQGDPLTFELTSVVASRGGGAQSAADIAMAIYEIPQASVTVVVA